MRFAIFSSMGNTTWADVVALWRHAEQTGWDAACVTDHFMPNTPDRVGDMLESWTTLTALAALTKRMRVGTIVSGNTYRHPAVLAKMAANVDIISGGRLICGMGAGWQENEHQAYGLPFYTVGERLQRLDEACQILTMLWTQERSTFKGKYYQLDDAPLMPKPVQKPRPELMVGGGGEKVTLKIVARWADHWNVWGGPDLLAKKGKILDGYCAAIGRDPKTILRSAVMVPVLSEDRARIDKIQQIFMQRLSRDEASAKDTMLAGSVAQIQDKLGRLREAGVGLLFVPTMFLGKDQLAPLDALIEKVAPALRKV
jgi:F420-dependent oxidoreductase-like protein